ncbi:hypothetical protein ACZ90_08740 [Streptomyces albus subsp. albus]|nr:hypothetical protein ACZ90_08740 [Streptomyces albus subsp. albus]
MLRPITADTPPPAPAGHDAAAATQLIPPVPGATGGAIPLPAEGAPAPSPGTGSVPLPPESGRPETPAESTTQLRAVRPNAAPRAPQGAAAPGAAEETQVLPGPIPAHGGPLPGVPAAPAGHQPPQPPGAPYAIRPGSPEERQPPAEFDGLFRADGAEPADSTQQLPVFDDAMAPPGAPAPYSGGGDGGGRRRISPAALIGIVVAGCAIAGLAAGVAISSGGGGSDDDGEKKQQDQSAGPEPSSPPVKQKPTVDPVKEQAKALDTLLADSNSSRASVVSAVGHIRGCKDLSNAATTLRTAAGQRNNLVTRLGQISVDKLPDHAKLTAALTKAWKSSAAADNHYAAWADQVGGRKGCHKGRARSTPQTRAGDRESHNASQAKAEAVKLWNVIATKYGLTERKAEQL